VTAPLLALLPDPLAPAGAGDALAAELTARGARAAALRAAADRPPYAAGYVARACLEVARHAGSATPVLLVAAHGAGPLLPAVGAAQRAAHRPLAGYLLHDALLPQPGTPTRADLPAAQGPAAEVGEAPPGYAAEPLPAVADWPDAPCGYLLTDDRYARCAGLARLRGWPVADRPGGAAADALLELAARL
jgi:hypothetical protein